MVPRNSVKKNRNDSRRRNKGIYSIGRFLADRPHMRHNPMISGADTKDNAFRPYMRCNLAHVSPPPPATRLRNTTRVEARLDAAKGALEVYKGGQLQWSSAGMD